MVQRHQVRKVEPRAAGAHAFDVVDVAGAATAPGDFAHRVDAELLGAQARQAAVE